MKTMQEALKEHNETFLSLNEREAQRILDYLLFLSIIAAESIEEKSGKDAIINGSNNLREMLVNKRNEKCECVEENNVNVLKKMLNRGD